MNAQRLAFLALLIPLSGCSVSYHARSAENYRKDTRALLETSSASFQQCYESVLASTPDAAGTVAVQFTVLEETGKISGASSLPESTAPEALRQCVVQGLEGLALDPPDERKGMATMTFDFARG
jgi:hypothetical protein